MANVEEFFNDLLNDDFGDANNNYVPQSPVDTTITNLPDELLFANTMDGNVALPEDSLYANGNQNNKRATRVDRDQNYQQAEVTQDQLNQWIHQWLNLSEQGAELGHGMGSPNTRPRKKPAANFDEEEEETDSGKVPLSIQSLGLEEFDSPYVTKSPSVLPTSPSNQWCGKLSRSAEYTRNVPPRGNTRRHSVTQMPYTPFTHHQQDVPQLDACYVKVHLMDMGYPNVKKEPKAFCSQVVQFICQYAKIFVGGFYLNNNNPSTQSASWILSCSYPSTSDFNQYFHYNVGERFIIQAAMEKRCFCVHSSSWENNSGLLSFLFVPIPNELVPTGNALAVMVLGTILKGEVDLHAHLLFLDQVRKPIAQTLRTLLSLQHNLNVLQRIDTSALDHEINKQGNVRERTSLAVANLGLNGDEVAIIATNLQGLITFMSSAAQILLGYPGEELVGKVNLTQLHELAELTERAKELQNEFNKLFRVDFPVLTYRTITSRGQDDVRDCRWVKKDGSVVRVRVTIRPLHDDFSVFGFVAFVKDPPYQDSPQNRVGSPTQKFHSPMQASDPEVKSE